MERQAAAQERTDRAPGRHLSWALCVATYNRPDALRDCVRFAVAQTRPPEEVVIVDAGEQWQRSAQEIAEICGETPLTYLPADARSLCVQRNQAIAASVSDILFLIDDDAFLLPESAEPIVRLYEDDGAQAIAAISLSDATEPPDGANADLERKVRGEAEAAPAPRGAGPHVWAFLRRELFLMSADRLFVKYDDAERRRRSPTPASDVPRDTVQLAFLSGYSMTVRRTVALREPFDSCLLAYCPAEDLDATYRFSRHGLLLVAERAKVYHAHAAAGRLKRKIATTLSLTNVAYFVRAKSADLARHRRSFWRMCARRVLAEFLKDLGARRLSFPQFRGILAGLRPSRHVLTYDGSDLCQFYRTMQSRILSAPGRSAA